MIAILKYPILLKILFFLYLKYINLKINSVKWYYFFIENLNVLLIKLKCVHPNLNLSKNEIL